jgi:predicted proteasome-type protease
MASEKVDLIIERGSDFYQNVYLQDASGNAIDVTGDTFAGQIKETPTSPTLASFTISTDNAQYGYLLLSLPSSVTSTLPITTPTNFLRYDLLAKNADETITLMLFHGNIYVRDTISSFS